MGTVSVTAGFMEPSGHGFKSTVRKAIRRDGSMINVGPGKYNIGFDVRLVACFVHRVKYL